MSNYSSGLEEVFCGVRLARFGRLIKCKFGFVGVAEDEKDKWLGHIQENGLFHLDINIEITIKVDIRWLFTFT